MYSIYTPLSLQTYTVFSMLKLQNKPVTVIGTGVYFITVAAEVDCNKHAIQFHRCKGSNKR